MRTVESVEEIDGEVFVTVKIRGSDNEITKFQEDVLGQTVTLTHPDHPVWTMAKFGLILVAMVVLSYINASNFDMTEYVFLGQMTSILLGIGGFEIFNKLRKRSKDE